MGIKDIVLKMAGINPAPIYSPITKMVNSNIATYADYTIYDYGKTYITSDDIYSIVRYLYTTASLIPLYVYQVTDDAKHKQLKRIGKQEIKMQEHRELMQKSLNLADDNDPLELLIENPNSYQNTTEFKEAYYFYRFLYGEVFIYKLRAEDGVNKGKVIELHLLEPQNVIIKVTTTLPRRVVAYDYRVNGQMVYENIPVEDVKHVKSINPSLNSYFIANLRGLSPLQPLMKRLERIDSNLDVSVAQMQNGGVETIVYDKAPSDNETAGIAGKRKDNFYKFLKDKDNAGAPFFATGEMGALHIGSSLADLKALEIAHVDFKKLCNAFGVSDIMFNNDARSTESNVKEMIGKTYTNTVLPAVYGFRDALIEIGDEFTNGIDVVTIDPQGNEVTEHNKGDNIKRDVQADLSEIPELQENFKELAAIFASLPVIVPNEILRALRYDVSEDPIMDQPLIKTGYVPIGDLAAVPDIPIVTPDGN